MNKIEGGILALIIFCLFFVMAIAIIVEQPEGRKEAVVAPEGSIYLTSGWEGVVNIPDGIYFVTFDNNGIDELLYLKGGEIYVPKLFARDMLKAVKGYKPIKFTKIKDNSAYFQKVPEVK